MPSGSARQTAGAIPGAIGFNMHRPYTSRDRTNYGNLVLGARGDFNSDGFFRGWGWDVYGQVGYSDADYTSNFTRQDRLNATTGFTNVGCDPSLINPELLDSGQTAQGLCDSIGGGIPWLEPRILRDREFNSAEAAFLEGTEAGNTVYAQSVLEGYVSGDLFQLPAGEVSAVFGFHLQHDRLDDQPGPNSVAANNHNFSNSLSTVGTAVLREVFTEVGIPIAKDKPFAERVYLTASGRYTENNRIDDDGEFTYKVSGSWAPIDAFRVRATYGTSYRTPALFELFQGGRDSFGATDPCINLDNSMRPANELSNLVQNCSLFGVPGDFQSTTNVRTRNQGNNTGTLKPETSEALNLGLVLRLDSVGLSFAVDYFDIEITDQIDRIGAQPIIDRCLVNQTFGSLGELNSNPFCALLLPRDADNNLTDVINGSINIAEQRMEGLDYTVRFEREFGAYQFSFRGQVTQILDDFLDQDRDFFDPVNDDIDRTLVALRPEFTGNLRASLSKGAWTVFWSTLYIGSSDELDFERIDPNTNFNDDGTIQIFGPYRFIDPVHSDTEVEEYFRHTASFRYSFDNGLRINGGIQNVFDEEPPQVGGFVRRVGTSAGGPYDFRGRSYFLRLTRDF